MNKATTKLLREYADDRHHFERLKEWWNALSRPEREKAAAEIRAKLRNRQIASNEE